jgi:hypothetical protein
MARLLVLIKLVTVAAFLVTLSTTYYLRCEVLKLSEIRSSSESRRAEEDLKERRASYGQRLADYEAQVRQYDIESTHYQEMLGLFKNNYDEYVRRLADKYSPPQPPRRPQKPQSPEISDKFAKISADFRAQQHHYFAASARLNWVAGASAMVLVAGLLLLIMFDTAGPRLLYLAVLVLSFVFMIGLSFHSILSAIVGFMQAPRAF